MLPRENRLKKRSAYKATYKSGKSYYKDGITLFCGKKKTIELPVKVGFVVSKKIHKRAVKRNRIKRLMRESVRLILKNNQLTSDYISLIFVATPKLLDKDFFQIDSIIKSLVAKI